MLEYSLLSWIYEIFFSILSFLIESLNSVSPMIIALFTYMLFKVEKGRDQRFQIEKQHSEFNYLVD